MLSGDRPDVSSALCVSGKLSIKAYKTSKPEEKLASQLGMIAGGTGERLLGD